MILELAIVILVTSSLPRHRRDNALQVKTSDEGERVSCNSCQMLLSHPMTCPQRKARPGSTSQAPRTYNSDLFQLFWKLPSMTLPSRLLPFALPSLSGSLSSLFSKIKSFRRVPKTEGGSSLLPPFCCASPKDTRSLAPSPAPPLDTTPCCSCASCRPCCSCCFCRDPKVQRTSDARWFTWLLSSSVASTAEGGVASGSTGGGGGGSGHAKSCGRCGGGFSIFFNKRVRCGGCDLAVCRKCAPWSAADKAYVCGVCSQPPPPKEAEPQSPDTQADAAQLKEVEESVRAHIEALTEGQVGGPLDHVNAVPNLAHSKARDLFARYHGALSRDLTALKYALQMSILNRPLPPEDLPTSRHAHLSERIKTVKEAMILPIQNEAYDPAASPETPVEDFNSHTYEDILATAILNKVLESCEGERPDEVTIEVSHEVTSTDTDSGMSGGAKESRRGRHKRGELSEGGSEGSEERSLTPPRRSSRRPPTVSPDQGVVTDDSWAQAAAGDGPPLQFKIEEHVEEITTHHLTDDDHDLDDLDDEEVSDSGGSWRGSRCSLDDSRERRRREKVTRTAAVAEDALLPSLNIPLPDPSHQASRRVSFPELGADIVHDSCSDTDCCQVEPGDMVMDNDTWEENWLFRRQRLVPGGGAGGAAAIHDPVTMLIPNPEAHVLPTVGNRDVDELSELSEQHSLGSGEPWSTSESEGEGEGEDSFLHQQASRELSALAGEIVAEFGQKDQEYTVDYSVPSRVSRSSGALTSPPHATSHRFPLRAPGDSPTRASHPQYVDRDCREGTRSFGQGRGEDALRSPERYDTPRSDSDGRCDTERPVPKPRKLSLATPSPAKTSAKSPTQYLPSPSEDLSILSPPLEVPNPKAAPTSSPAVWFVAGPEDCTVTQGRTLRLVCQVNTKRPMGLSWYHNGSLIPSGGRDHWLWRQGSYHHLHVFATTPDTAGVYAAAAYTANTCVWAFCRVLHKSSSRPQKRPSFTKGLSDVIAEEGSEVTLQCQVTGHPEPRVTFSRGSERLASSSRVFIESDQYGTWTVKLSECSPHDSGEIVASASNHMGTTTTRCHVRIVPEGTPIPREETDNRRAISSPSKHDHPSAPGRRHDHRTHGSHKAKSSGQAATTNHSALASANTSPHRVLQDPLTTFSGVPTDADDLDEILQVPTKPGTIAEREHRKWEAAVPLANNPYAPERLVQRLSHSRSSSTTHIPRALRVDFPEDSPKDLDPSLRDGVPPQADLKRYSRDYYVATSANNSGWQRSPQAHHVSQQPRAVQAQLANGHHLPTSRSTSDLVSSQVHIRLVTGVSESAGELKKASPEGATEDLLHREEEEEEEEEDSSQSQEGGAIRPSKRGDWKDELRDIQSARVEREVARFQRTIDETQRRWEENYGRVAPRSVPATGHSDSSTEGLHNPRPAAYLVPPRHDLWRTVSVDTLGGPARDRPALQPLLRHTSVDNLRPSTKVSNLSPLGPNPRQSSMNTVSSLSNINLSNNNCGGNKTTTATAMTTYQSQPAHGQSVESMSGYSDGESHGDGNDSDVSTSTPDKVPMLPSVRKLASKFDVASRERVNDLDKHGKDGSLAFNGKKNIFIEKSSPTDQPYIRNLTNNLNKRTEKTYNVKEVRSLPNSSNITHETQPASDTDTYFTDHDDSEFDDQATVTSVSLPPTPHSLNGRLSYSTSSLLDSDSCYSLDDRDQSQISPGEEASKTIFGVTLRKVSPWSGNSRPTSSSSSRTNDETAWHNTHYDRQNSYSSSVDSYHERIPISETDSDSDAPNALRQVTIIKIDDKPRPEHQSMTDLSVRHSKDFSKNRRYSSTFSLSSENEFAGSVQPVRKTSLHALPPLQPLNVNSRQKSMPNLGAMPSIAFAPKGRKRSMRDFLKSYQRQTSLSEINRIEEKVEEEWGSQRNGHVPLQRMTSVPSWHRSSFHEEQKISPTRDLRPMQEAAPKHEPSPVQETDQTKSTKENAIESPTVTYKNTLSSEKVFPSSKEEIDTSSNSKTGELRETKNSQKVENFQHESDDESSMSDSTITSEVQEHTGTEPVESDDNETPMNRAKSVSDLLKLYTELETKAGRPPSRTTKKEIFGSQDLLDKEPNRQNYERETFSRSVSRNNEKQNDFLDHGKAEADKNEREYLYSQEQVPRELTQETSPGEPFSPNDERVKNSLGYLEIESSIPKKEAQEPVQVEPNQVPSNKEPPSPAVVLDDDKVKDFLGHIAVESDVSTPDSAKELEEPNIDAEKTGQDGHKKPLVKAKSISDLLKLYSDKRTIGDEIPSKLPTKDSAGNSNKTIITLSDNEHYPKAHQNSAKIIPSDEPVSVHRSRGTESVPPKKAADFGKAISYDQPDSRTSRPQQDLPRSERANPQKTRTPTSGSVPSKRPVFTQNAKPFGKLSKSEEKAQVTNTDRNGNSVYEGHDNRTVINVSDNSSDSVYFASYINIDSEDSGYSPTKYPSYSDVHQYSPSENNNTNREYSSEDFSFGAKEQNTTASSANQELVSTSNPWVKYSQIIPIDMDSHSSQNTPKVMTEDTNHNSVQVIEKEAKGPHVTVISLSEGPPSVPPPAPPSSDETSEDDAYCDPLSLTRMIVHGSRCGSSSNRKLEQRKKMIESATVPRNSPFSPLKRKQPFFPDPTVTTSPPHADASLHKMKLRPQNSYDEGVDLTLSDAELAQSAVSSEAKSTSSVDTVGKDSPEPRVLSD
ncbi:uncharacterized protein LOC122249530 isoform X9 [Penaeus japonicus]|uniref:uncharacterized protein LOC122249530 isoform X9 n=1 Tax=Penaeus japonicus TaxID=27405 RepID=UPI001C70CEF2|nr:uncharacterized protein LOC122249530 isoform X9 [Penaeus japonicus]